MHGVSRGSQPREAGIMSTSSTGTGRFRNRGPNRPGPHEPAAVHNDAGGLGGIRTHMSSGHDILSVARLPVPPLALLPAVQAPVRGLKTVAVRAQNPKILDAIIGSIAVDVVQLNRHLPVWRARRPSAKLAPVVLEAELDQSLLQLAALVAASGDEDRVQRNCREPMAFPTLVPGPSSKMGSRNSISHQSRLDLSVVASCGHEPQGHQYLPHARR